MNTENATEIVAAANTTHANAIAAGVSTASAAAIYAGVPHRGRAQIGRVAGHLAEPRWMRALLIGAALGFLAIFLLAPLAAVFVEAFRRGAGLYLQAISDPDAWAAIRLTLLIAAISLPFNITFGLAAAWAITRYRFRGQHWLVTLIDLPFTVSPVVAGLVFVLLFGHQGWLGEWLRDADFAVIYAVPGVVLATLFVTFPFVARTLIPLMHARGNDEEYAALTLGASGWTIFRRITLPNVRWGLLYGAILANARAIGEFGAVSMVSGHIRGETNTMTLHVEILYNEYMFSAAFAVASLLALLALATLALKRWVQQRSIA